MLGVLDRLKGPIVDNMLAGISYSEIFLNRSITCWGAVNFKHDWVLQAVGFAFWLNGGRASGGNLMRTLGITSPSTIDAAEMLDAGVDVGRIVSSIIDADLENDLKAAILRKRAELKAYLTDIGFFGRRRVAFCDLGYSGSAVRDLNLFLLQEGADAAGTGAPLGYLNLIASSDNFAANGVVSLPFVRFNPPVLMGSQMLPPDLKENFAWLELFFKHPTMEPVTGLVESDGRVVPDIRHRPAHDVELPSEQVLAASTWSAEDIVLLWMASQRSLNLVAEPIIERFAHPDLDTVAQVDHAIYEVDAVNGTLRSAVLIDPHVSEDELVRLCRQQDYWIAGSKVASAAARAAEKDDDDHTTDAHTPRRTGFRAALPFSSPDIDVGFYRAFYADLAAFGDQFLRRHYVEHGKREGRFAGPGQLLRALIKRHGPVPADFDPYVYVSLHHDLRERLPHPLHGYEHYLKHGRSERRSYVFRHPELEADFDGLLRDGTIAMSSRERRQLGRKTVVRIFCERHGVVLGGWVDLLVPAEFKVLNASWAGEARSRGECLKLFLERGLAACAPVSIIAAFDPDEYRLLEPVAATLSDEEAYRHWLGIGFYLGKPPSEAFAVYQAIGETEFPACFDWQGFAASEPSLARASRTAVLRAFTYSTTTDPLRYVQGNGAAQLLTIVGMQLLFRGATERAVNFLEAGLVQGGHRALLFHYLGDAYRAQGQLDRALATFARAIDEPDANRWSFINGAELALEANLVERAIHFVDRGRPHWNNLKAWRQTRDRVHARFYDVELRRAEQARDPQALIDVVKRTLAMIGPDLPERRGGVDAGGPVMVLTGQPFNSPSVTTRDGRTILVFQADAADRVYPSLFDASLLIVHDASVTFAVLELVATAKALGVRTIYAAGPLDRIEGVDLSALVWRDAGHLVSGAALPLPIRHCCAAFLFDAVVNHLAGLTPVLTRYAAKTPVEHLPLPMLRVPASGGATLLLVGGWRTDEQTRRHAIEGLRQWAASDHDAVLLCDASFSDDIRLTLNRLVISLDLQHDLDDLPRLLRGVDFVVELGSGEDFSFVAEAAAMNIAGLLVAVGHDSRHTQASARRALTRLSESINDLRASHPLASVDPSLRPDQETPPPATDGLLRPAKPRVLFFNVYFPPQSIGGATRVLKDNLDFFLDQGEDPNRFAVVTTDLENDVPGEMQIDSYRGVRIYRLSTPQEIDMDWRTENAQVAAQVRRILRHERPDLVHVHCVPRLSVSPVEECRRAGIPYIVTLHDAWWISDYPFLTDRGGLSKKVREDLVRQDYIARIGARRSWSRGFLLREILLDAHLRLSVSASFAAIYQQAGIPCDVLENGVSPMHRAPSPTRRSDRVSICHVGGLEHHKGAYLLEIALKRLACRRLTVTVIDLGQETGYEQELTWGATPVRKIGRVPNDQMAELYARMDVLVAPSTWPESYGLVTREATKLGLWVIASRLGAIGDGVRPDENGFLIDVNSSDDLADVLRQIDADPSRFQVPPAKAPMRTSDDQGRALLEIYEKVVPSSSASSERQME